MRTCVNPVLVAKIDNGSKASLSTVSCSGEAATTAPNFALGSCGLKGETMTAKQIEKKLPPNCLLPLSIDYPTVGLAYQGLPNCLAFNQTFIFVVRRNFHKKQLIITKLGKKAGQHSSDGHEETPIEKNRSG